MIDVLDYVDGYVPGFKRKAWKELCDMGYIANDTFTYIDWDGLCDKDTPEKILEGIKVMFDEFPDIKNGDINFHISW